MTDPGRGSVRLIEELQARQNPIDWRARALVAEARLTQLEGAQAQLEATWRERGQRLRRGASAGRYEDQCETEAEAEQIESCADELAALRGSRSTPEWCPVHQHYKWCEHNGGVLGVTGHEAPAGSRSTPQQEKDEDDHARVDTTERSHR